MDLVEDIGEVQVVDAEVELEADEVARVEGVGAAEDPAVYHLGGEEDFEVVLEGLEEVAGVEVGELVVPDLDVVLLDGRAVEVAPQPEGGLSVAEHDIEEGDHLVPLALLLALLAVGLVVGLKDAALHVQSEVVLEAAGGDFGLEDALQPGQLDLLVDNSQVAHVDAVEVQQLGQLVGRGEVVLFVLEHADELVDLCLQDAVDLLWLDQPDPVPEDLVLELL